MMTASTILRNTKKNRNHNNNNHTIHHHTRSDDDDDDDDSLLIVTNTAATIKMSDHHHDHDRIYDVDDEMTEQSSTIDDTTTTNEDVLTMEEIEQVPPLDDDVNKTLIKKQVVFAPMVDVIEVESYKEYDELWYTRTEMIMQRKEDRSLCQNNVYVQQYIQQYETYYTNNIFQQNHTDTTTNNNQMMEQLVSTLQYGYQGIEREASFEQIRQYERHDIVKTIVASYRTLRQQQIQIQQSKYDDNDNHMNDDDYHQTMDVHDTLGMISQSLTAKMSMWASYLGIAAHLAIRHDKLEP